MELKKKNPSIRFISLQAASATPLAAYCQVLENSRTTIRSGVRSQHIFCYARLLPPIFALSLGHGVLMSNRSDCGAYFCGSRVLLSSSLNNHRLVACGAAYEMQQAFLSPYGLQA